MGLFENEEEPTLKDKFARYYVLENAVDGLTEKQKRTTHESVYRDYLDLQHELFPLLLTGEQLVKEGVGDTRKERDEINNLNRIIEKARDEVKNYTGEPADRLRRILSP